MVICHSPAGCYVLDSGNIMRTLVQVADIDRKHPYGPRNRSDSTCLCNCHIMVSLSLQPAPKGGWFTSCPRYPPSRGGIIVSSCTGLEPLRDGHISTLIQSPPGVKHWAQFVVEWNDVNMFDLLRPSMWRLRAGCLTISQLLM